MVNGCSFRVHSPHAENSRHVLSLCRSAGQRTHRPPSLVARPSAPGPDARRRYRLKRHRLQRRRPLRPRPPLRRRLPTAARRVALAGKNPPRQSHAPGRRPRPRQKPRRARRRRPRHHRRRVAGAVAGWHARSFQRREWFVCCRLEITKLHALRRASGRATQPAPCSS